jgi:hypothetical protein
MFERCVFNPPLEAATVRRNDDDWQILTGLLATKSGG